MKVTKTHFLPIQIVLETPEEVKVVLDALNKHARHEGNDLVSGYLARTMYNQLFFHARLLD